MGSVSDAEDIVSEAWARWCAIDAGELDSPGAWLTTVTTRLAIDWLRRARHDRETYVGPWLPEPVLTEPGPEERAELADSLTLGFLTLLDRLEPVERAVFLMADVFEVPFATIAEAVDKTPAACRQVASRARRRLRQGRIRARPQERRVVDEVLVALAFGDMETVLARLAPDVVCVTDGGANRRAARRPVVGSTRVARFLTNLTQRYRDEMTAENATINDEPGVIGWLNGEIDFVGAFEVEDGLVRTVRLIRNPDKLRLITSRPQLL
ncbi:MAG: RNA polymerase sigma factor SigJ [Actinomycetota bacterium]|nr:RNA polymerase sigma factor SigJ [Actinomycetota bacterium]